MTDARTSLPATLTVGARFNGPAGSANGGYIAGLLASALGTQGGVQVTLRQPPPLEQPMTLTPNANGIALYDGDALVAQASPENPEAALVDPVTHAVAAESPGLFPGRANHPYPTCFVCGNERHEGDGLRLFPGRLPQRPDTTACAWTPDASLVGADGERVAPEFVWAALDCPGGWTALRPGLPLLLGRLTACVDDLPYVGDDCVVMGRLLGRDGRKVFTATTLYDGDGRVAARADAVWIAPA